VTVDPKSTSLPPQSTSPPPPDHSTITPGPPSRVPTRHRVSCASIVTTLPEREADTEIYCDWRAQHLAAYERSD